MFHVKQSSQYIKTLMRVYIYNNLIYIIYRARICDVTKLNNLLFNRLNKLTFVKIVKTLAQFKKML